MFGLSTKEILKEIITNACNNCIEQFKSKMFESFVESMQTLREKGIAPVINNEINKLHREYLELVATTVFNTLKLKSQNIYEKTQVLLKNPQIVEISEIHPGITAGQIYAICFYAIKNKLADPIDISEMDDIQMNIRQQAIDSEKYHMTTWAEAEAFRRRDEVHG